MNVVNYQISNNGVAFEYFEDEAIVINLPTGKYYSLRETALFIWKTIENKASTTALLNALTQTYEVSAADASKALTGFLQQLQDEELIVASQDAPAEAITMDIPTTKKAFTTPVVEVYTDMQEIILLDPVHEVNVEQGWPVKK